MAIIALNAAQEITDAGITPAYQGGLTTTDTYTFPNDGRVFLHFKKTGAGAATVTVVTPATNRGKAVADTAISVPATTGDVMAGPFPTDLYNSTTTGLVTLSASDIAGLTVAVLRWPIP